MTLASSPFVGHICPNADHLRSGVDDLCDLPEPWRRLAYTVGIDSQHDCSAHAPRFCKHAVWREVVASFRVLSGGSTPNPNGATDGNAHSEQSP